MVDGLRLGVGREERAADVRHGRPVDAVPERPGAEVGHVVQRVGRAVGVRPHVADDHGAAVGLRVVVALQRFEVRPVEVPVVRRPVDRGHGRVRAREVEVAVPARERPAAILLVVDPDEGDADRVGIGDLRRRRTGVELREPGAPARPAMGPPRPAGAGTTEEVRHRALALRADLHQPGPRRGPGAQRLRGEGRGQRGARGARVGARGLSGGRGPRRRRQAQAPDNELAGGVGREASGQ